MEISKYKLEYEEDVLAASREDSNWDMFTTDDAIGAYRKSLKDGVTYVCYENNELCGSVRALLD
jgi:hypothetical protein